MTSDREAIRTALTDAVNESKGLRTLIEGVPERVAGTVASFVPVDETAEDARRQEEADLDLGGSEVQT
jgi:hypothetical protein